MSDDHIIRDMQKHSLYASNAQGLLYSTLAVVLSGIGIVSALSGSILIWMAGQIVLAFAFIEWFVILHEAGHRTLFRSRWINQFMGVVSAFMTLIPYTAWRHVHARHHVWTGWQDRDITTETLVPRPLVRWERWAINGAWRSGIPLFSVLYRTQNFWNTRRLARFLDAGLMRRIRLENFVWLTIYIVLVAWLGLSDLFVLLGPGLLLALAVEDILLLSQHTHMPTQIAGLANVQPLAPRVQQACTRSLCLPRWWSWMLMHFDAHELHHMHVRVPGYRLRSLNVHTPNEVHWWHWLRAAKKLSGVDFLFGSRDRTGMHL
ncbi:MAG: fatty acid desaturase [Gammaproteobacteria bacterium]|nr:fatty acid desaturase [Gammaproteobacteria bacterium]